MARSNFHQLWDAAQLPGFGLTIMRYGHYLMKDREGSALKRHT